MYPTTIANQFIYVCKFDYEIEQNTNYDIGNYEVMGHGLIPDCDVRLIVNQFISL